MELNGRPINTSQNISAAWICGSACSITVLYLRGNAPAQRNVPPGGLFPMFSSPSFECVNTSSAPNGSRVVGVGSPSTILTRRDGIIPLSLISGYKKSDGGVVSCECGDFPPIFFFAVFACVFGEAKLETGTLKREAMAGSGVGIFVVYTHAMANGREATASGALDVVHCFVMGERQNRNCNGEPMRQVQCNGQNGMKMTAYLSRWRK